MQMNSQEEFPVQPVISNDGGDWSKEELLIFARVEKESQKRKETLYGKMNLE